MMKISPGNGLGFAWEKDLDRRVRRRPRAWPRSPDYVGCFPPSARLCRSWRGKFRICAAAPVKKR